MNIPGTTRAPILRAILAVSGGLVALDDAWAVVLGWRTADLTGAVFIERVHPDDLDLVIGAIHSAYGSGAPVSFTCRYAHRDGSYLRLAWEAVPQSGGVELDLLGWAVA